jgi:hypothetical protein
MRASIALLLLVSCGPSVNPAAKADVDAKLAAIAQQQRQVAPPQAPQQMPLAVGQWTKHKNIDQDGKPSIMTYKIVAQDGDAFWVETVLEGYTGRSMVKMLVNFGDRRDPATIDLRDVWMMDAKGRVNHVDGVSLAMVKGMMKNSLSGFTMQWQGLPQEDVTVPAGVFGGCFKGRTDVTVMGRTYSSMGWHHPEVPLSGMVKSRGIDRPTEMVLVDYGTSGAQSEFPATNTTVATPPAQ